MRRVVPGALAVALFAAGAPLVADAASTKSFHAKMNGANEVPDKGDPDGRGQAQIRIKGTRVCWSVSYTKIARPGAGHIHKGAKGDPGPVVVTLFSAPGKKSGCTTTTAAIAADIVKNPTQYYVNLHNAGFPGGAIRGQLRRGSGTS